MKKFLSSLLIVLSLWPAAAFAQGTARAPVAAKPAAKPDYKIPFVNKKLSNGLEVIVYQDNAVPIVTVELDVRNGSFTEPPELNGLSHLFEHMFFKTNQAIVRREPYLQEIGQLGITYNGSTREEVVNYFFTTTHQHAGTAVRFISDAVRYPVFDEREFAAEKQVVIREIDRNESKPFLLPEPHAEG